MKYRTGLFAVAATTLVIGSAHAQQEGQMQQEQAQQQQAQQQQGQQQSRSEAVKELQQALNDQGYSAGPVDGIMGPQTQSAVRNYQEAQGMQASGEVDQETLSSLGLSEASIAAFEEQPQQQQQQQPGGQMQPGGGAMGGGGGGQGGGGQGGGGQMGQ